MNNLHANQNDSKRSSEKRQPKYGYVKDKLNNALKKLGRRKGQLSVLQLEIAFLQKRVEMYKLKLGM